MLSYYRHYKIGLFLGALVLCCSQQSLAKTKEPLNQFFERVYQEELALKPMPQTYLGLKTGYGKRDDFSDEATLAWIDRTANNLSYMEENYPWESLSPEDHLSYRLFEYRAEDTLAYRPWVFHSYPVNQLRGVQSELASFLINAHTIDSVKDAQDYIVRLAGLKSVMENIAHKIRVRADKGISPPTFSFPMSIEKLPL